MRESDLSRAKWRKSSYSNGTGGSCVEITELTSPASDNKHAVAVRDSKDPQGPVLALTARQWRTFTAGVKAGEFDLP
jgi:hypothetical protein